MFRNTHTSQCYSHKSMLLLFPWNSETNNLFCFYDAGDWTKDLVHDRPSLYHWITLPAWEEHLTTADFPTCGNTHSTTGFSFFATTRQLLLPSLNVPSEQASSAASSTSWYLFYELTHRDTALQRRRRAGSGVAMEQDSKNKEREDLETMISLFFFFFWWYQGRNPGPCTC